MAVAIVILLYWPGVPQLSIIAYPGMISNAKQLKYLSIFNNLVAICNCICNCDLVARSLCNVHQVVIVYCTP